jgi:outer membrane protein OmpA-like peptidoglycan-associated protein
MLKRFFSILVVLALVGAARAEASNVEIDLNSLNEYAPPPMFGTTPQGKSQKQDQEGSPVIIYNQELEERDVVQPSVEDILRQLDGREAERTPAAQPPEPKPQVEAPPPVVDKPKRVYARQAIKKGNIHTLPEEQVEPAEKPVFEPLNYVLQFDPSVEGLTPEQKAGIRAAVLPAVRQSEGVRLLIYAYATGSDGTESQARRLSLFRAQNAKDFLVSLGVLEQTISILALGDRAPIPPENKLVFVTKI